MHRSIRCVTALMLQPRIAPRYLAFPRPHRTFATTAVSQARSKPSSTSSTSVATGPSPPEDPDEIKRTPLKYRENALLWKYKPRTPGLRWLRQPINEHLWKGAPLRQLTYPKVGHGKGGRNNSGRITVRHRGGGHRRRIRAVDFHRLRPGLHEVLRIEYDPNRSAHLAVLRPVGPGPKNLFVVGPKGEEREVVTELSYILAAEGMRAGDRVQSYRAGIPTALIEEMGGVIDPGILAAKTASRGNCLPLHMVPLGTQIFNIGTKPGGPGVFCRSAGTYGIVVGKDADEAAGKPLKWVSVRLSSGEIRRMDKDACATIGMASNPAWQFRMLGKAGRSRWLNIRPTVRGVAMNANDHPHGGGRGKSKGNRIPVSPWGTPAKSGFKTRRKSNVNKFVVKERPRNLTKKRSKTAA